MKTYEIRLKNGDTVYTRSKRAVKEYIGNNRDQIKGVFIIKNNMLIMFITNQDIQNKEEEIYL